MSPLRLSEEPDASEADRAAVVGGLKAFNLQYMPASPAEPLTLLLRDEAGAVRGGLLGATRWHWLFIDILWVDEDCRGQGHGQALLARAEAIAAGRGCRRARLDTAEFQARGFYENAGYRLFGELDDCPPGWRTFYLEKAIEGAESA